MTLEQIELRLDKLHKNFKKIKTIASGIEHVGVFEINIILSEASEGMWDTNQLSIDLLKGQK